MANATQPQQQQNQPQNHQSRSNLTRQPANNTPTLATMPYMAPFSQFFQEMDRMFENTARRFGLPALNAGLRSQMLFQPQMDIASNDQEYAITVEVPGADENDIRVEVSQDGLLTIKGEKCQQSENSGKNFHQTERSYGFFQRTLPLPPDANPENIQAEFKNGVICVTVPREGQSQSQPQPRQIRIQAGNAQNSGRNTSRDQRQGQGQGWNNQASDAQVSNINQGTATEINSSEDNAQEQSAKARRG